MFIQSSLIADYECGEKKEGEEVFGRESSERRLSLASAFLALNIPLAIVEDDVVDGEERHIEEGRRLVPVCTVERRGPSRSEMCGGDFDIHILSKQ